MHSECLVLPLSKLENLGCRLPPKKDMFNFNVDGTLFNDFHVASVGAILMDFKGNVLLATRIKEPEI